MTAALARLSVGFFGITRSLRHTAPDIHAKILAPLQASGLSHRIYGHFHQPKMINNPRTGEFGLRADPGERALLPFDRLSTDPQDDSLIAPWLSLATASPDLLQDGYASVRNLCFQLRSLAVLWDLILAGEEEAPWVLFLRPDLRYLDALDIPELARLMLREGADLAIPDWHGWGGLNDRFALASPRGAAVYARRGDFIAAHMQAHGGLHAETLLAHAVTRAGLRITPLPARALRIRAGGWAEPRDLREFGLVDAATISRAVADRPGPAALASPR